MRIGGDMFREIFFWFTEYLNYFALIFFGIKLFLKKYDVQTGRKEWVENVIIFVASMPVVIICVFNYELLLYTNATTYLLYLYMYFFISMYSRKHYKNSTSLIIIYINSFRLIDLLLVAVIFEVNSVSRQKPLDVINIGNQRSLYLLLLIVLYYLIVCLLKKGKIFEYLYETNYFRNLMCLFSYLGIICFCRSYVFGYEERTIQYWFFYLLCIAMLCGIFLGYIVRIRNEEENRLLNMRNDLMKNHYLELRKAYDMNRMLYHDFKNHILVLNQLIEEQKIEDLTKYINSYMKDIPNVSYNINSGCEILDIILNTKITEIESKNIKFKYDISYIGKTQIEDVDYCALLANLLDNAIEACEKIEGKIPYIIINIIRKNDFIFIKLINTINLNSKSKEDFFVTDKNNKLIHGLGLRSIERVVKKYNGYIEYLTNDNEIECFISMSTNI